MAKLSLSPIGEFTGFVWINKPDTKFNDDGVYKVDLTLEGDDAERLKDIIEAAAKTHLAEHTDEMPPAKAKKWSLYVPFDEEEDEAGEPTGRTTFHFKQNAKIRSKSGEVKDIAIEIRDSKDNIINVPVFSGCEGRIMFSVRGIEMSSTSQAGVRLDFYKVQITKLAKGGSSKGFGAVDDGFVADSEDAGFGGAEGEDAGGDY
jgi:hypothetical protein